MEFKQFSFVALFAVVAVVGFAMMFMATVTPADTGLVSGTRAAAMAAKYNECASACQARFDYCINKVQDTWIACMSVPGGTTDTCENPKIQGKDACRATLNQCLAKFCNQYAG